MTLSRLPEDQPPTRNVCGKCGGSVHAAAPDTDPDAARWYHDSVADDVFCGLVMHAPDRVHSAQGICTLAPKRPHQDVGICRACLELGLFDAVVNK
jgi:hypothetical protein